MPDSSVICVPFMFEIALLSNDVSCAAVLDILSTVCGSSGDRITVELDVFSSMNMLEMLPCLCVPAENDVAAELDGFPFLAVLDFPSLLCASIEDVVPPGPDG